MEGTEAGYCQTLQALLKDYDAAVAINVGTSYLDNLALARGIVEGARGSAKPVLANFVPEQLMGQSKTYLKQNGIASFSSGERAVKVLAEAYRYSAFLAKPAPKSKSLSIGEKRTLPGNGQMLEPQAMAWLIENGIPVPPFFFAVSAEEAVQACEELGYPAVMKVVSPDILHKSDFGGVVVGIRDASAARQAFETVCRSAQGKDFRGAVIYPMIRDAQEVLIGISKDPQFGPVVAFGLGGVYTEIMRDIVLRVAPVDSDEAMQMVHEIRAIKLLQGARGKPACDFEALAQTIATFSHLPFLYPEISEIDLNPVFLLPKGLFVGDVRVIR